MLQLMLDILILPYKWSGSDEDPLAGFNAQSLKRLRLNIPLIFTDADYHEQVKFFNCIQLFKMYIIKLTMLQVKLGILGLISANIFKSQSILVHSVVGAADTRYMVANSGENELRKITWYINC